jgi:acylpyruvate hydrolase
VRFATIRNGGTSGDTRAVRVDGEALVEVGFRDVGEMLASSPDAIAEASLATGREHALASADFAPLVVNPEKIICQGLNYRNHILEMGHELPTHPTLFAKFADALVGARDAIVIPSLSEQVDWEAELALVVGRTVRHATPEEAADAIAGFTVANDVSMRDWQNRSLEWLQGKTWEHATPVGPWLVTPGEVGGPAPDLPIRCEVDGVVRQESRTGELVFSAADLLAYASQVVTLRPGDLILTGTPAGVGHARRPPVYLQPGQVVRTTIEGIGELVNACRAERAEHA